MKSFKERREERKEKKELLKENNEIFKEAKNMSFDDAVNVIKKVFNDEKVDETRIYAAIYIIGKNKLKELGIDYDIFYKKTLDSNSQNTNGQIFYNKKRICLKLRDFNSNDFSDYNNFPIKGNTQQLLVDIFHEIGHAKHFEIDNYLPSFNYKIYYYCENEVVEDNADDSEYYINNYGSEPGEFIAETYGLTEANSFFIKHGINNKKKILERSHHAVINDVIESGGLYNRSRKINGTYYENIETRIDEIMSDKEKRKYYLDEYPILKLKYNDDGTNNSLQEVIDKIDRELEKNPELLSEYANFLKVKYERVIWDISWNNIDIFANIINTLLDKEYELLNIKSSNEKLNKAINIYKYNLFSKLNKVIEKYSKGNASDILKVMENIKLINFPAEFSNHKDIFINKVYDNLIKEIQSNINDIDSLSKEEYENINKILNNNEIKNIIEKEKDIEKLNTIKTFNLNYNKLINILNNNETNNLSSVLNILKKDKIRGEKLLFILLYNDIPLIPELEDKNEDYIFNLEEIKSINTKLSELISTDILTDENLKSILQDFYVIKYFKILFNNILENNRKIINYINNNKDNYVINKFFDTVKDKNTIDDFYFKDCLIIDEINHKIDTFFNNLNNGNDIEENKKIK